MLVYFFKLPYFFPQRTPEGLLWSKVYPENIIMQIFVMKIPDTPSLKPSLKLHWRTKNYKYPNPNPVPLFKQQSYSFWNQDQNITKCFGFRRTLIYVGFKIPIIFSLQKLSFVSHIFLVLCQSPSPHQNISLMSS